MDGRKERRSRIIATSSVRIADQNTAHLRLTIFELFINYLISFHLLNQFRMLP